MHLTSKAVAVTDTNSANDADDDLSDLKDETGVPDDVRKWLASTFSKPEQVTLKDIKT